MVDAEVAGANVLILTNAPAATALAPIRAAIAAVATDPTSATVAMLRQASPGMLQRLTGMALVVATLGLSLAGVGLDGRWPSSRCSARGRSRFRMAIGAPRAAAMRMLLWEGGYVVGLGRAAGMALTGVAFRFMSGMIFARWSLDPFAVAGVLATFAAATPAACYVPGRRALRIDPMRVLKGE